MDRHDDLGRAIPVHDYQTLAARLEKLEFYKTLVVSGPPGRGKTELARSVLDGPAVWFSAPASASRSTRRSSRSRATKASPWFLTT